MEVRLVHMIRETADHFSQSGERRIGLLSTTGTRDANVYRNLFEPLSIEIEEVDLSLQNEVHETIYDPSYGLKATVPASDRAVSNFESYARRLAEKGVSSIVLGCTEIPLAFSGRRRFADVDLIDPVEILARSLIREADPEKLLSK